MTKTKITAEIIADSMYDGNPDHRVTTMLLTFPRHILSELNTHRAFSRNSASSRAIPFNKMVQAIKDDPFIPIAWQKDHKGMQGTEYITEDFVYNEVRATWMIARDRAVHEATNLNRLGVTKQICNRLLEPFMWHKVIVTSTDWDNFFELRCPQYMSTDDVPVFYKSKKDYVNAITNLTDAQKEDLLKDEDYWQFCNKGQAEIHMMALAEAMWDAYNESIPERTRTLYDYHIPFKSKLKTMTGWHDLGWKDQIKVSTAMCARVSYTTIGEEKEINFDKLIQIHDAMAAAKPFHASPFEHCCSPHPIDSKYFYNLKGWISYRYELEQPGPFPMTN